jgi:predicted nucleic acid-binding protein
MPLLALYTHLTDKIQLQEWILSGSQLRDMYPLKKLEVCVTQANKMSEIIVVDASVALSWLLPGEETNKTLLLRDYAVANSDIKLLVPPIFWYEVANVLWVAVKKERIVQSDAMEGLKALLDFKFDIAASDPTVNISISFTQDIAVYDSAYLSVAQNYNATLWTIDKGLVKAAKNLNVLVEPKF